MRDRLRGFLCIVGCLVFVALRGATADAAPPQDLSLDRLDLKDHRGRLWSLGELTQGLDPGSEVTSGDRSESGPGSMVVVAFLGTECPLAKLYAATLAELDRDFRDRGVRVVGVMSNRQDSLQKIGAFVDRGKIEYPILVDPGNRFADRLGAERTPEVFLFGSDGTLRYWGRIDDRYGIGYARDAATREDLRIAIEESLDAEAVSVPVTRSVGCIIGRRRPVEDRAEITYAGQVAEILHRRCTECHRDGEIAPFSMADPEEVAGWADMMAEVVREGRMPPWHASPEHGEFSNDRTMPEAEKEVLYAWAEAGAPAGDLAKTPPMPTFTTHWQLPREPDRVIPISEKPFVVPAKGAVKYQYFKVDLDNAEDLWLEAAELQPGNRQVVHHILAFARPRGSGGGLDAARGFLVGYVPGARHEAWPAGMAKRIPQGSELIFQIHYTPIGTPQEDQSRLGLVFADPDEITHEVITSSALQTRLNIPPGDRNHVVYATSPTIRESALLLGMSPHMHVRGKSYRYELDPPEGSGKRRVLLDIPQYDFNWQTTYVLAEPIAMAPGTSILGRAVFDNSASNLNNPDPLATVRWGDQTWEEMMIGYFHYAIPIDRRRAAVGQQAPQRQSRGQSADDAALAARLTKFRALDTNRDGKLTKVEVPKDLWPLFDNLDRNGDGVVTEDEAAFGR